MRVTAAASTDHSLFVSGSSRASETMSKNSVSNHSLKSVKSLKSGYCSESRCHADTSS